MTQNSALSQNWFGCTRCTPWPSLRTQAVHPAPRPTLSLCVLVVSRLYRSLWPTVSQDPSAVSWPCRWVNTRAAARRVAACGRPCRRLLGRIVAVSLRTRSSCWHRVAARCMPYRRVCCDTPQQPSLCPLVMIQSFVL